MDQLLNELCSHIEKEALNVYRVSILHGNGCQETRELRACNPCQNSYSVAKAFTLTALGFLWDEGKLKLDSPVTDILGELCPEGIDPRWRNITVDMVIRHHSGLPPGFLDIDTTSTYQFGRDFLTYLLTYPLKDNKNRVYSDGDYYLLARIAQVAAGRSLTEYLWEKLFYPLEFQEVSWSCCPMGHPMGATGLYLRTEDMVKLGGLYLHDGVWMGERLLSHPWCELVRDRSYLPPVGRGTAYGHGGIMGQMLMVSKQAGLAIAWHGYDKSGMHLWVADYIRRKSLAPEADTDR